MQWFWSKIIMFEVMLPSAVFQCFCPNTGILMTAATHVCCMEAENFASTTVRGHLDQHFIFSHGLPSLPPSTTFLSLFCFLTMPTNTSNMTLTELVCGAIRKCRVQGLLTLMQMPSHCRLCWDTVCAKSR